MAKSEDQQAAQMLREFENRLFWAIAFHASLSQGARVKDAAQEADDARDAYQERFPPIQPPD